jgi:hypothetical protein
MNKARLLIMNFFSMVICLPYVSLNIPQKNYANNSYALVGGYPRGRTKEENKCPCPSINNK